MGNKRPQASPLDAQLSRRESQLMNVVYRLERATAEEIRAALPDPPSNSSVRTLLGRLEEKGHLDHEREGRRFVYFPSVPPEEASRSALRHLAKTFFGGSPPRMVATLLSMSASRLSDEDLDELSQLIERAKQEGQ